MVEERSINITRYLTILITGGQAPGYIANLQATLPETAFLLPAGGFWYLQLLFLLLVLCL